MNLFRKKAKKKQFGFEDKEKDNAKTSTWRWPFNTHHINEYCNYIVVGHKSGRPTSFDVTDEFKDEMEGITGHVLKSWDEDNKKGIAMILDYSNYDKYPMLQKRIAELIQHEPDRPTIKLIVKNCQEQVKEPYFTVGLLGGVGPLADAEVLTRMMDMLSNVGDLENFHDRYQIKLLSAPPPRVFLEGIKAKEKTGIKSYKDRVRAFFKDDEILSYEITSNTAHDKILTLQRITKSPFTPGARHLVNVVATTTQFIQKIPIHDEHGEPLHRRVLIVGTDQAWKDKLYQKALSAVNVEFVDLNYKMGGPKGPLAFKEVEEAIILIKNGDIDGGGHRLLEVLHAIATHERTEGHPPITIVAWTCSEVSLGITVEQMAAQAPLLANAKVIDTTELMALNMVEELLKYHRIWTKMGYFGHQNIIGAHQQYINSFQHDIGYDNYGHSISVGTVSLSAVLGLVDAVLLLVLVTIVFICMVIVCMIARYFVEKRKINDNDSNSV